MKLHLTLRAIPAIFLALPFASFQPVQADPPAKLAPAAPTAQRTTNTQALGDYRVSATCEVRDGGPWITVYVERPAAPPLRYSDLKVTAYDTAGKELPVRQGMEARFLADSKSEQIIKAKGYFTTQPDTLKTLSAIQVEAFGGKVKLDFEKNAGKPSAQ